ncbi:protein FAM117A isoform X1 [Chelonoidis abingdonii]|uniref:protein FAM117A isoform X1 n=1 Tax=Chelonoidis abingdonii TaxID=106734 RepID=UPI0013F1F6AB|nr:protein FAM117A isoform X1 [Chelonoidis abingdonii]
MAGAAGASCCRGGVGGLQPLRATIPFQLQQRRGAGGDGGRAASVPCATAVEKTCRTRAPRVRRTSSLDTILGSYLLGQWPRDADGAFASCMNDKATQTPTSWHEVEVGKASASTHKRSASWGSTDHRREIAKLKQQLQRTKLSGKEKDRSSPLQGDHAVLGSVRDSPPGLPPASPVLKLSPCLHRSLEGLNQELEEVFVKEQGDEELLRILDVPDGHRAPAPPQRGSEDLLLLTLEPSSSSCSSLSLSPSPSVPLRSSPHTPARAATEELSSVLEEPLPDPKEKESSQKSLPSLLEDGSPSPVLAFASSPRPNHSYMFKREPPEGCEKVRAFEEALSPSPDQNFLPSCPDKNKVHFNPTGSAFCPVSLVKPLFPNMGFLFRSFPTTPSPVPPGTFTSCQSTAPGPFLGSRKDSAADGFSEVSKSPPLNFEHWKRTQTEESVLFHSSLVV